MKRPLVTFLVLTVAAGSYAAPALARDLEKFEWYVRLSVSAESEGLLDRGNVLGQLNDAALTSDDYDLRELSPFSFNNTSILTIVFYHPEWGLDVVDYSSDYHPVTKSKADEWAFEVRSDDAHRDLVINWEGAAAELERMVLVDLSTGEQVPAILDDEVQQYAFNMGGLNVRAFQWSFLDKSESGGKGGDKKGGPNNGNGLVATGTYRVSDWPPAGSDQAAQQGGPPPLPPDPFGD